MANLCIQLTFCFLIFFPIDVAQFLRVNPYVGLFFFDGRFRPVPLEQTFIGVKALNQQKQMNDMNEICYDKVFKKLDFQNLHFKVI